MNEFIIIVSHLGRGSAAVQGSESPECATVLRVLLLRDHVQYVQDSDGLRVYGQSIQSGVSLPKEEAAGALLEGRRDGKDDCLSHFHALLPAVSGHLPQGPQTGKYVLACLNRRDQTN